ncbi:hypothetical protein [Bacillus paranthracis]|uniref:hypothetical protein n=1 Tax=Bacillus paranthracis TaxID=2026186 RepID=UPI000778655A|nr:hypothetical protein [Bacillus paranthracis]KXY07461.1 hypothetical protein AT271_06515 [Bacillus cereus]MCC2437299.1 hypothetical protein [Bacillus paranthracis]MDG1605770.1 hypothetical protein [Bacillus paranthracis]
MAVTLDEETYDMIDEYLQSAIQVIKEMYQEYGEEIFDLLEEGYEHFEEFRDKTYELTETISDDMLKGFKNMYVKELTEALNGEVTPIVTETKDVMGQLEYHLQIHDTKIILHKRGRRIDDWGSDTPTHVENTINRIVMRG